MDYFSINIENAGNNIRIKESRSNLDNNQLRKGDANEDVSVDKLNEIISKINPEKDQKIYNPKKIPLGLDGKPIPYWLFKLNNLDKELKCEICGNMAYYGRKAFDMHFQEWRHAYGMSCLKVPNTIHFKGVTKIEEVLKCK